MDRHKVFISYHDGRTQPEGGDWEWRVKFEKLFTRAEVIQSGAVQDGDIDPNEDVEVVRQKIRDKYLFDSSVTVVLVGERTWQRKHVDWEISASIRHTTHSPRSGLLGILLPSHPSYRDPGGYDRRTIPPRLYDNIEAGFAKMYGWTEDPQTLQQLVHEAYLRKGTVLPDNSRQPYAKNRTGERWAD
ncbi:MAG TPA: TIR domain-containing protein [Longimicrobium sp.]